MLSSSRLCSFSRVKTAGFRSKKPALLTFSFAVASFLAATNTFGVQYDLSAPGSQSVNVPGFGGFAIISDYFTQPAGTGVFEPFLTIDANGHASTGTKAIEQGYNTSGLSALYMDQFRPHWNRLLRLADLAPVHVDNNSYYAFLLDANEPGGNKSVISIDNIRVYTSPADNTSSVQNNNSSLNNLGTLRWAMNQPIQNSHGSFNIDNWIKLDSAQENVDAGSAASNGGSGKSDMVVYIPVSAFDGAHYTDYVWFYNLNGVHEAMDVNLSADAGYEEWRAVQQVDVPDSGATITMVGLGLAALAVARRRLS